MRRNSCRTTIAFLAGLLGASVPGNAARFGTVVSIGGQASDLVLDETRQLLYVSNFTANRIEVISTADYSRRAPIPVSDQPGALSLSPDSQTLIVTHYGNWSLPHPPNNLVTLVPLNGHGQTVIDTQVPPLGVAYISDGRALIVTTTGLVLLDPTSRILTPVTTFTDLAQTLPVDKSTFPLQVTAAQLATNANRSMVYGIADLAPDIPHQIFFKFDVNQFTVTGVTFLESPKPLPRLSVPSGTCEEIDVAGRDLVFVVARPNRLEECITGALRRI